MRYIINNHTFDLSQNANGHGRNGHIKKGSWYEKSIVVQGIKLNKGSAIDCLIHQYGQTQLRKGWFSGSTDNEVKKAFKRLLMQNQNQSPQLNTTISKRIDAAEDKITVLFLDVGKLYLNLDVAKAFNNLKKAADRGNAEAQRLIANMYLKGQGTIPSDKEAFKYFKWAANQNNTEAQFELAQLYASGRGTSISEDNQAYRVD